MELAELKAIMRYKDISQRELAEVLGVTKSTFNEKINGVGGREFLTSEINAIGTHLDLTPDEVIQYFFPDILRNARKN